MVGDRLSYSFISYCKFQCFQVQCSTTEEILHKNKQKKRFSATIFSLSVRLMPQPLTSSLSRSTELSCSYILLPAYLIRFSMLQGKAKITGTEYELDQQRLNIEHCGIMSRSLSGREKNNLSFNFGKLISNQREFKWKNSQLHSDCTFD